MEKRKTIAFAYYANDKFIGWYGDTAGSVCSIPKIYGYSEEQIGTIQRNFNYKISKINKESFEEAKEKVHGIAAFSLLAYSNANLLVGKKVELRIVECPVYDGPNPDFDKDAHDKMLAEYRLKMEKEGIFNIPAPSFERTRAVTDFMQRNPRPLTNSWIYANFEELKEWSKNEPTKFIKILIPNES